MLKIEEISAVLVGKIWNILSDSFNAEGINIFHTQKETQDIIEFFLDLGIASIDRENRSIDLCHELKNFIKELHFKDLLLSSDAQGTA